MQRALLTAIFVALINVPAYAQSATEARAIAKEATIYGFPLLDSYRIQYSYFADRNSPEFKAPWNQIFNNARVYTPDDKAIQTPNSDTPYSYVGADLRAEPIVLTVPQVEKGRYYSLQFIDMYTFNFAYVGSRATGNGAGSRNGKVKNPRVSSRSSGRKPSSRSCFIGPSSSIQATLRTSRRYRQAMKCRHSRSIWVSQRPRARLPSIS